MDNRVLYGVMTLLFNAIGVPCFMQGKTKAGIIRIVLTCVTCGVVGTIQAIMGIVMGIQILTMKDEEFAEKKSELLLGIPSGK